MGAQPEGNDRATSLAAWAVRLVGAAVAAGAVLQYQRLSTRVGGNDLEQQVGFHAALGLLAVGSLLLLAGPRRYATLLLQVSRGAPVLSGLLAVNVAVTSIIVLSVLTEWGVIVLMALGGMSVLWCRRSAGRPDSPAVPSLLLNSPLTFGILYLALIGGEAFLRLNPMLVGGGGGGNPALATLYKGLYSFNSQGLRGDELSLEPAPGVFRILALGDSFTFGQGVPDDSTWAELLERRLNENDSTRRFEVVNGGRSGWATYDQLDFLETRGLGLRPDLLILQFFANDIDERRSRSDSVTSVFLRRFVTRPFRRSYVVLGLRFRFEQVLSHLRGEDPNEAWLLATRQQVTRQAPAWREFQRALGGIARLTQGARIPTLVLLFPRPGARSETLRAIHLAVQAEAEGLGLRVVDLTDDLATVPPAAQVVSRIDHHPSGMAHAVAAGRLATELSQQRLIPVPGSP